MSLSASNKAINKGTLSESFVSIVVPIFNERLEIALNLDLLVSEIEEHFRNFEVIAISDGSTDGTNLELARFVDPNVKYIIIQKNQGKGFAVREGFKAAKGDYVFFIDGGMELHPKELRVFIGLMSLYDADIVIGSKRHPQSSVSYPWYRRTLSFVFQQMVRLFFKVNISDTQVGLKLVKRKVLDSILPDLTLNRYGFDLEMLCLAQEAGYTKIMEAPVRLDYFVTKRTSIQDLAHVLRVGSALFFDTVALYFRIRKIRRVKKSSQ